MQWSTRGVFPSYCTNRGLKRVKRLSPLSNTLHSEPSMSTFTKSMEEALLSRAVVASTSSSVIIGGPASHGVCASQ